MDRRRGGCGRGRDHRGGGLESRLPQRRTPERDDHDAAFASIGKLPCAVIERAINVVPRHILEAPTHRYPVTIDGRGPWLSSVGV